MYFVLLVFEKLTGLDKKGKGFINILKRAYTLLFVILGWVLFRADNMGNAYIYLKSMFSFNGFDGMFLGYFTQNAIILTIGAILSTPVIKVLSSRFKDSVIYSLIRIIGISLLFIMCIASLVSNSYNPFIYFNF